MTFGTRIQVIYDDDFDCDIKFESIGKMNRIQCCHHFEDNENMKLLISW